jgi:glutathione S-transferase
MKLYFHPGSSNARKARVAAALLNLDLDLQFVDIGTGAHKKPEYLAKNPNGMIPTLDDDGFVLWEANAITQYLASKRPAQDLFPTDAKARAVVAQWQCWDLAHWTPAIQTVVFERVFKKVFKVGPPDAAAVERGLASFNRFAAVLNGHLEGKDFVAHGHLTLADVSLSAAFTHGAAADLPIASYKHVQRWLASLDKLDAWKKTAPALG